MTLLVRSESRPLAALHAEAWIPAGFAAPHQLVHVVEHRLFLHPALHRIIKRIGHARHKRKRQRARLITPRARPKTDQPHRQQHAAEGERQPPKSV